MTCNAMFSMDLWIFYTKYYFVKTCALSQQVWERRSLECVLWENLSPRFDSQLHIVSVSEWNKIIIATGSLFFSGLNSCLFVYRTSKASDVPVGTESGATDRLPHSSLIAPRNPKIWLLHGNSC